MGALKTFSLFFQPRFLYLYFSLCINLSFPQSCHEKYLCDSPDLVRDRQRGEPLVTFVLLSVGLLYIGNNFFVSCNQVPPTTDDYYPFI